MAQVVAGSGELERIHLERPRACCSEKACKRRSWTVYEATGYPHRSFQLPVGASAVAEVAAGKATLTQAAKDHACDRRSVGRWLSWTAELADPAELSRTVARLSSDGIPPPPFCNEGPWPRALAVLFGLELLDEALRFRGVELPAARPGLMSILAHQHQRFGDVFWLTKPSPPLRMESDVPAG